MRMGFLENKQVLMVIEAGATQCIDGFFDVILIVW